MCITSTSGWTVKELTDESVVLDEICKRSRISNRWGYRGQPGYYDNLIPSLDREFIKINTKDERRIKLKYECASIELFKRRLLDNYDEYQNLDSWDYVSVIGLLQHYGGCTRLLDWSFSPFTALYFAVSMDDDSDCEIWCIDYQKYLETAPSQWINYPKMSNNNWEDAFTENSEDDWFVLEFLDPKFKRVYKQNGFFSMTSKTGIDHAIKIKELFCDKNSFFKYKIDKKCKHNLRKILFEKMDIWYGSIYPDIFGAGYGTKERMRDQIIDLEISSMKS